MTDLIKLKANTTTAGCNTTWTRLGTQFPNNIMGVLVDMDADKVTPGLVYVWTNGGGFWIQAN